ncbi:cyclin-I [Megalops cyprinoides]|uniref:cyclin-I n=1 Tax=Megalops cyprinoides TaxID=118141 RepID=UPI0018647C23|nr:cyclin-I [Megalops cyprinoides]
MKLAEPLECQRLSFLLEKATSREAKMWKVYVPKNPSNQDTDISPAQRDEAVRWLSDLHSSLKLYPETLSLAISILDRFLAVVKARPKYLRCIAIACFFLAAKTSEEDEHIPALRDLARTSGCGCSPSEILRMERIILDKLNWDLHTATPLDFLHIFHAMVLSCKSQFLVGLLAANPSQHMAQLTRQLHHCLAHHTLLQIKGSMLALALITLELEKCCPDWLALTINLLKKAQIDSSQLISCRELVARVLSPCRASLPPNTVYIYQPLRHSLASRGWGDAPPPASQAAGDRSHPWGPAIALLAQPPNHPARPPHCKPTTKRKVEAMEVDEFYDGIKRLYNEDSVQEGAGGEGQGQGQGLACSTSLVRQEGSSSPCPPLQPVPVT